MTVPLSRIAAPRDAGINGARNDALPFDKNAPLRRVTQGCDALCIMHYSLCLMLDSLSYPLFSQPDQNDLPPPPWVPPPELVCEELPPPELRDSRSVLLTVEYR